MKQNLVNPVHFFNERGHSTLSFDHLLEQNKRLKEENERLTRMLRAKAKREELSVEPTRTNR